MINSRLITIETYSNQNAIVEVRLSETVPQDASNDYRTHKEYRTRFKLPIEEVPAFVKRVMSAETIQEVAVER